MISWTESHICSLAWCCFLLLLGLRGSCLGFGITSRLLSFKTGAFFKLRFCCKYLTAAWIQEMEDLVMLPSNSCNLCNFLIGKNKPIVLCSVPMFARRPKLSLLLKYPRFQGQRSGSFSQPFCWQYLFLQLILPSTQFIEFIN